MKKIEKSYLILIFLFISIFFSFYFSEDSTGGARNDYLHHERIIFLFAENFTDTFSKYGTSEVMARNSPVFYVLISFLINLGIDIKIINYLNAIILPIYLIFFLKCIKLKYPQISLNTQLLFSSVILISPTIRSLVVWPIHLFGVFIFSNFNSLLFEI